MEAANPFAQAAVSPEPIIAQVSRQLRAETQADWPSADRLVDGVVDRVVRDLWDSRIKTFVPILALRESRAALLGAQEHGHRATGAVTGATAPVSMRPEPVAGSSLHERGSNPRDALAHHGDDTLHVNSDRLSI